MGGDEAAVATHLCLLATDTLVLLPAKLWTPPHFTSTSLSVETLWEREGGEEVSGGSDIMVLTNGHSE